MNPYDTLTKDRLLAHRELATIATAARQTNESGLDWLCAQLAPNGPIMEGREFSTLYKTSWALWRGGRADELGRLLDWIEANALQPNGDVCFPDRDRLEGLGFLLLYRQSYIVRAAARSGHPLATRSRAPQRILEFQHSSGAAVGRDPDSADPETFDIATTSAFGMAAIDVGALDAARRAGEWVAAVVAANASDPERFYSSADGDGRLARQAAPGEEVDVVLLEATMQPTQVLGIAAAFLVELYIAVKPADAEAAARFLSCADAIFAFESRLPFEAFFNWNRVKLAWSAGLRLGVAAAEHHDPAVVDAIYRLGRRTYMHSLAGTRLADGGWGHDLYPAGADKPETRIDQRTLEGISAVPTQEEWARHRRPEETASAHRIEVSAENVFVTGYLADGLEQLVDAERAHGSSDDV